MQESQDIPIQKWKKEMKYYCLLVKIFMISEMHASKIQIMWSYKEYWVGRIWYSRVYWTRKRYKHWFIVILPLQLIDEKLKTKLMIVYLQIVLKLKPQIVHRLNISIEEVKDSLRIFRRWKKFHRRTNIRSPWKHKIINEKRKRFHINSSLSKSSGL